MKNLLVTTAIGIAMASTALANSSTVNQINTGNLANVTQTGGTGSTSDVNQTGSGDIATVLQSDGGGVGTNDATIQQLGGSGVQTASVTQNNAVNGAVNTATVTQDSTQGGNVVSVNQDGDGNTATAEQGPGAASVPFLFGSTLSVPPEDITNSTANISQFASGNTATTLQVVGSNGGDNNFANTLQSGTGNEATIRQGTGALQGLADILENSTNDNDNFASINQNGDGNESTIEQGGESGFAVNIVGGNDNTSTILQSGGIPGLGNTATVEQLGDRSTSVVEQTSANGDLPLVPALTTAVVFQDADDSNSTILQKPLGGHFASVSQLGDTHSSMIDQNGLLNAATVRQELSGQTSTIDQTGPSLLGQIGNTAAVTQLATAGNNSDISQMGAGNSSVVMQ